MICETTDGGSEIRLKNMERVSANEFELSSPVNGIPYLIARLILPSLRDPPFSLKIGHATVLKALRFSFITVSPFRYPNGG